MVAGDSFPRSDAERERDEVTCSPPRLHMVERNSRLLESLLGGGTLNGLRVITKWHQILGFGTEIQGESFKGSPAFHPGRDKHRPSLP